MRGAPGREVETNTGIPVCTQLSDPTHSSSKLIRSLLQVEWPVALSSCTNVRQMKRGANGEVFACGLSHSTRNKRRTQLGRLPPCGFSLRTNWLGGGLKPQTARDDGPNPATHTPPGQSSGPPTNRFRKPALSRELLPGPPEMVYE